MKSLITTIILFIGYNSYASHSAGGYFEYECLGNGNYKVDFYFLRQCGFGSPEAPNFIVYDIFNSCGLSCGLNTVNAPMISVSLVDFGCGNNCEGGEIETGPSTQLYKYSAVVNLPSECAQWYISADIFARNTVDYAESNFAVNYYTYCMINNTAGFCNSSVKYSGIPFAIGCANGNGKSMYSISNPDGSTLNFSFVSPLVGDCSSNGPVDFVGGASVNMPYPSNGNFNLNNSNGEFTFSPTSIGTSYFAVKVSEYSGATLVGETIIDGLVFSSSECELGGTVNFENWQGYGGSNILITEVEQEYCGSFTMEPNDNGENITNVTIHSLEFVDYTVVYNPDGSATVEVCVTVPEEYQCQNLEVLVIADAITSDGGCISQLTGTGHSGYYTFFKPKGEFCPDYLFFTNRNSTSGLIMPNYARADNTIWVGDNMPPFPLYDPAISGVEGNVEVNGNLHLVAGNQIFIPACDIGSGCVTIIGDVTLEISPYSCNSDCEDVPLNLSVHEIFQCGNERLVAEVEGNGPFTYKWEIDGQIIITSNPVLGVHDIVSELNYTGISYTCTVLDASGASGSVNGQISGTFRFYQDIHNNMNYYDGFGYMYQQVSLISNAQPASIYDEVNWAYNSFANPPYYGATHMEFTIWPLGQGAPVYDAIYELEGGDDFSINNFEVSWNGHIDNDVNQECVQTGSYNYTLIAKNCYTAVHTQQHHFTYDGENCYHGGLDEIEARPLDSSSEQPPSGTFNKETEEDLRADNKILIIPNPAKSTITLNGKEAILKNVTIFDNTGRILLIMPWLNAGEEINVEGFAAGIYTIQIGDKRIIFSKL